MKNHKLSIWMLLPVFILANLNAQNIKIHDSLAANADLMKVKLQGQGFGKMMKMKFGDYAMESSKQSANVTTTKKKLFDSYTETKSKQKFSFVLSGKNDTAYAYGAKNIETNELRSFNLLPGIEWGTDALLEYSDVNCTFININQDSTDTWTLLIRNSGKQGSSEAGAILTNGKQGLIICPVTSGADDKRSIPAQGFEFMQDSIPVAAVQYYGGGVLGLNKNIVWIDRNASEKIKIILAASATVLINNYMLNVSALDSF